MISEELITEYIKFVNSHTAYEIAKHLGELTREDEELARLLVDNLMVNYLSLKPHAMQALCLIEELF